MLHNLQLLTNGYNLFHFHPLRFCAVISMISEQGWIEANFWLFLY